MIKIIYKLLILAFIGITVCYVLILSPIKYKHSLSLIINKYQLLSSCRDKKIILVGGSNLIRGVDSAKLSRQFNYNVINLGLFAGFGIPFLLHEAKNYLNPGDVVIVAPEMNFNANSWPNKEGTKWMLALDPIDSLIYVYPKNENWKNLFRDISELCCDKLFVLLGHVLGNKYDDIVGNGLLSAESIINDHGDALNDISDKRHPHELDGHGNILPSKININFIHELNSYYSIFNANNIKMYMLFPIYPYEEYIINYYQVENYYKQLTKKLKFDILGYYTDFLLPVGMFTDTVHHLSFAGKNIRTDRLIQILSEGNYL